MRGAGGVCRANLPASASADELVAAASAIAGFNGIEGELCLVLEGGGGVLRGPLALSDLGVGPSSEIWSVLRLRGGGRMREKPGAHRELMPTVQVALRPLSAPSLL